MQRKILAVGLVCLAQTLVACGFQLRGDYDFPPEFERIYVESRDPAQTLIVTLVQSLETKTTGVVQNRAAATAVIRVISNSFSQRTLSFDSRGRPREFEMAYVVEFEVTTDKGGYLPRQAISLTRAFEFDGVDVSAGGNQREIIRRDLQVQMARSILRRIAAKS